MQTVLQISKIVIQADTIIGQFIHKVEVAQLEVRCLVRIVDSDLNPCSA